MINKKSLFTFIALVALLLLTRPSFADTSVGELEINRANGQKELAILLSTHISGDVNGMIASIKVDQNFKNQSDDWVNGRYVFPLPPDAAVDSLTIQIGERVIKGVIKEKAEAKKTFEAAKRAGKKAGLLEQHRPNLFSISVANIGPQETVRTTLTFINKVRYQDETFSLRLPTTLTPRYIPGATIASIRQAQQTIEQQFSEEKNEQTIDNTGWASSDEGGWSANTDRVNDASAITPPQVHATRNQTNNLFSLALSLDAGLDLQMVDSTTHQISNNFISSKQVEVSLANGQEQMNNDLVLSWKPTIGSEPKAALFQQKLGNAYYSLLMVTPPSPNTSLSLAREITFIIDSSGSMAGGSMTQAKQALHDGLNYLSRNDRFNIIDFDSSFRPLFTQSQAVNQASLAQAGQMIDALVADGGTEMTGALNHALSSRGSESDQQYLRQIVFITDGAIGNENELFKLLNNKLGDARLFTVGIGSAPNAFFMNKAAKFGRGSYTYISNLDQVSTKMGQLFKRITHPVLRDIKIDWQQQSIEQYPSRLPDLYAGEPLSVLVKSSRPLRNIKASGTMLNTPWKKTIKNRKSQSTANNLDTVWARDKIASLMDKLITGEASRADLKPQIIELGIKHHIVTKFTSFVAVEQQVSKPANTKAKHKNIPNLMPKGSTMPVPQTATPTDLFAILGCVFMLIGVLIRRRSNSAIEVANQ